MVTDLAGAALPFLGVIQRVVYSSRNLSASDKLPKETFLLSHEENDTKKKKTTGISKNKVTITGISLVFYYLSDVHQLRIQLRNRILH